MSRLCVATMLLSLSIPLASAQNEGFAPAGHPMAPVPVQMVITAEPFHGFEAPPISPGDVSVLQNRVHLPVTEWLPLQGDNAALELFILIDERVNPDQGMLFGPLRSFVSSQPPSTAVGIAYMHNGEANIVQAPTKDHAGAARALRASSGNRSANASPYASLSALISRWPVGNALRREVVIVTDGMDVFETFGLYNVYVEQTIKDAQFAGVQVYCFYAPSLGHSSHSPALIHWGQTYLGQLAEETGGEAYLSGSESPASFEPYLVDLAKHLSHQYRVTFLATPVLGDSFQRVRFHANVPSVELISAYRFYLKAPEQLP